MKTAKDGLLVKHNGGDAWGEVAIKTMLASFAVISEQQDEAVKRIGSRVKVKPDKEQYDVDMKRPKLKKSRLCK